MSRIKMRKDGIPRATVNVTFKVHIPESLIQYLRNITGWTEAKTLKEIRLAYASESIDRLNMLQPSYAEPYHETPGRVVLMPVEDCEGYDDEWQGDGLIVTL